MEYKPSALPVRFYEIDLLRFVAAFAVMFYHYAYRGWALGPLSPVQYPELPLAKYGYLGVELFFLISGYVVLMSAYDKSVRDFFVSRVARLYPAYWVACTITFLVTIIWGPKMGSVHWQPEYAATVKIYLYNMTMLQEFFGQQVLDTAYWTLRVEIGFYFLIAVFIGFRLMKHLDVVLMLWLGYTALVGPLPANSYFAHLLFPEFSPFFAAGMILYMLQHRLQATWKLYSLLGLSFLLALRSGRAEAEIYEMLFKQPFSQPIIAGIISLLFLVMYLVSHRKIALQQRWLASLGALTYPLYLLHGNIGWIISQQLYVKVNRWALLIGLVIGMLLAAYLLHTFVEKRYSKLVVAQTRKILSFFER
ncbi:acyltransferase [Hymenobacter taeanensis]|uniref:Acyltransferase n=1 Tax=Hymenobacter taeanensis TaxID=2735321 RepID=A0A6M6BGS2_9BACT|nr:MULTISPECIES: acyltransferase [Hymenobacter]QJX47376.1 acyltransferase [Hymenobacter taeanensis]UOQ79284.1 acyltransferase [Hymenobacter sp. 5414T-23]